MGSLLERVTSLTIDRRGDIRLTLNPQYTIEQPELNDLWRALAELRVNTFAAAYILLVPLRSNNKSSYSRSIEELRGRYFSKGTRLGWIREVTRAREDYDLVVKPTKEFVARACSLWDVGIARGWLMTEISDPVWLQIFPSVGQDVEDDGFEVGEDTDWQPRTTDEDDSSSGDDDEQDDIDIGELMDLSDAGV